MKKHGSCEECGCEHFKTTKTVFHEITVKVQPDGTLKEIWQFAKKSTCQPDSPYGYFVCVGCNKTYENLPDYVEGNGSELGQTNWDDKVLSSQEISKNERRQP